MSFSISLNHRGLLQTIYQYLIYILYYTLLYFIYFKTQLHQFLSTLYSFVLPHYSSPTLETHLQSLHSLTKRPDHIAVIIRPQHHRLWGTYQISSPHYIRQWIKDISHFVWWVYASHIRYLTLYDKEGNTHCDAHRYILMFL